MKTLTQISKEINISKKTIYKMTVRNNFKPDMIGKNNMGLFDIDKENIIINFFKEELNDNSQVETSAPIKCPQVETNNNSHIIETLEKQIEFLENQCNSLTEQNKELLLQNSELTKTISKMQQSIIEVQKISSDTIQALKTSLILH